MKSVVKNIWNSTLFRVLLVLSVSLGFITYNFRDVSFRTIQEGMKNINTIWLIIAVFIMLIYWFLESQVLYKLTKKVHGKQTVWQAFKITMIGQFFNTITPFASGGQPAELYNLHKNGVATEAGASILLIKFIIFQVTLVLSSIITLVFGYDYLQNGNVPHINTMIVTGFAINFLVICTLITVMKSKKVTGLIAHAILKPFSFFIKEARYDAWKEKLNKKLLSFHEESNRINFDFKLILQCVFFTAIQLWLFFSIPYFILQGLGITNVNLFQVISYHSFVMMFSSMIPIPGGSGGAEYSFSLLFGLILKPAQLIVLLFLWRSITYYSCIIVGSFFLFTNKK